MIRFTHIPRAATLALAGALSLAACSGGGDEAETPEPQTPAPASAPPAAAAPAQPQGEQPVASPRDTAEMRFADGRIFIDYGRPSMRGRTIMGGLVPYGRVWRAGANAATTLVTTRDVRLGDVNVPAGTYTLYALPGERDWQLIVNRQTGQWGTEYDQAQDLARIPMQVERIEQPVEQFTIDFTPAGGDNAFDLDLRWENTRARVRGQIVPPGAR
jgi:hypothetical protein